MEKQCKTEPFKILMQTSKNIQDQIKVEISKSDLNITEFSVLEHCIIKDNKRFIKLEIAF